MATTQVILYFESPSDALRFTLAASSALSGEGRARSSSESSDLSHEIKRATRIRTEAATPAPEK